MTVSFYQRFSTNLKNSDFGFSECLSVWSRSNSRKKTRITLTFLGVIDAHSNTNHIANEKSTMIILFTETIKFFPLRIA